MFIVCYVLCGCGGGSGVSEGCGQAGKRRQWRPIFASMGRAHPHNEWASEWGRLSQQKRQRQNGKKMKKTHTFLDHKRFNHDGRRKPRERESAHTHSHIILWNIQFIIVNKSSEIHHANRQPCTECMCMHVCVRVRVRGPSILLNANGNQSIFSLLCSLADIRMEMFVLNYAHNSSSNMKFDQVNIILFHHQQHNTRTGGSSSAKHHTIVLWCLHTSRPNATSLSAFPLPSFACIPLQFPSPSNLLRHSEFQNNTAHTHTRTDNKRFISLSS